MNTTENNKIIAEFMGAEIEGLNYRVIAYDNIKVCMHPNKLNYHKDWNWLMGVVEKIEGLNYDFQILGGCWVIIKDIDPDRKEGEEIIEVSKESKILTVYNACVEFIKWYNENGAKNN